MFEKIAADIARDAQGRAQLRHEQQLEELRGIRQALNAGVAILKVIAGEVNDIAKKVREHGH